MIHGRDRERARLAELVGAPAAGRADALLVVGDAGIGKTVLVEDAVAGVAPGVRVLRARGYEGEAGLAFAGLTQLVRPLLGHLEEIPGSQAAALKAALALGPPVVMDRFAAYAGLVALLATAAQATPLVVVVDDAHWLDVPSAEALGFSARRLGDDAVALLLAARREEGAWLAPLGLTEIPVGPLPPEQAEALLSSVAPDLAEPVRERLLALAGGNPLALVELPAVLEPAQRRGQRGLPDPLLPGEAVTAAFGHRLLGVDDSARIGVTVAAVSRDGRRAPVEAAAATLGGVDAVGAAEAAGLLRVDGEHLELRHPLLRGAVLRSIAPGEIRRAHRALAEVLTGPPDTEARAWHLAEAAVGPDEEAAGALDAAAGMAAARTAYASGANALERAAALSAVPDAAAGRLLGAAQMAQGAGESERAIALLDRASENAGVPALRTEIGHMRGLIGMLVEPLDEVYERLLGEAARCASADPARSAQILADAVLSRTMGGACDDAVNAAERAFLVARALGEEDLPPTVTGYLAGALVLAGRRREAAPFVEAFDAVIDSIDPLSPAGHMAVIGSTWKAWLGDFEGGLSRLSRWLELARGAGGITFLGLALGAGAEMYFRAGNWAQARAHAEEAVAILGETRQTNAIGYVLSNLALIDAATGRGRESEENCRRAEQAAAHQGIESVATYVAAARGLRALGEGDLITAAAAMEPLPEYTIDHGLREPMVCMWQPDLVETYVRLGRLREARQVLRTLAEQAYVTDGGWAKAVTSRCRGMIDPGFDHHFRHALDLHAGLGMPFEEARTRLVFGERLRRARRRAEAREQLEAALAVFERLGARPWAARAGEELAALGVVRRTDVSRRDELTPRELQVALAVADGLSNREVASRLFISEKTVERHLSAVFGKLGVRSRTELTRRMADPHGAGSATG